MTPAKRAVGDAVDSTASQTDPFTVAVVVPVLSDAEPLDRLYAEYSAPLSRTRYAFEVLFMLEPWGGEKVEPLRALIDAGAPIRLLEAGQSIGETAMLVAAVEHTDAPIIVTLLPYFRVAPDALLELVQLVDRGEADVATARRRTGNRTFANRLLSGSYHSLLRHASGCDLRDLGSGARAVNRSVFASLPLYGDSARYLPVLALREGHVVQEILVEPHPRHRRLRIDRPGTYVRRLVDLIGLTFLFRFSQKPLRFFGMAGSALFTLGAVVLAVLFVQRLGGQSLASRPVLLLGTLLAVLGLQAIALGLIGEMIVHLTSARPHYRVRSIYAGPPKPPADTTGAPRTTPPGMDAVRRPVRRVGSRSSERASGKTTWSGP